METAIAPTAVLASFGTFSVKVDQGTGARPLLKARTKMMTDIPDKSLLCTLSPIPRVIEEIAAPSAEKSKSRFDPTDWSQSGCFGQSGGLFGRGIRDETHAG